MIKNYLLKILQKFIVFLNSRMRVKLQPSSPSDLYFEEVAKNSYETFKTHFKNAYVFSDDDSIRNFAINESIKRFDNSNFLREIQLICLLAT